MHLDRFSVDAQGYFEFVVSSAGLQINKIKAIKVFSMEDEI